MQKPPSGGFCDSQFHIVNQLEKCLCSLLNELPFIRRTRNGCCHIDIFLIGQSVIRETRI